MNTQIKFEDFIFHDKLEKQLKFFVDNPEKIPGVMCFYGTPGIGKTSFGKWLGDTMYGDHDFVDCGGKSSKGFNEMKDSIEMFTSTLSGFLCDTPAKLQGRLIVLDEFSDLTKTQQVKFKNLLDKQTELFGNRVIICMNTDSNNGINKVLDPAIKSRSYCINFNPKQGEQINGGRNKVSLKFPNLPKGVIKQYYPDMRTIQREVKMIM